MAEWILMSSLLIVIVLAVRALFRGRMGLRLRYALWLLVLLRLLVPGTVFQTGLSVLNYVPLSQTAAAQAQPSQSGGSPSAPEAEPMPVRPEGEAERAGRHMALGAAHGFSLSVTGYPGWPGDRANPLAAVLGRVWREQTGRTLELSAVHVGLEPSVFRAKAPGLVMASAGPDILDAHSVDERAPLDGLPDYALLLAGAMEAL